MIQELIEREKLFFRPLLESASKITEEMKNTWRTETVAERLERVSLETFDLCGGKVVDGLFRGLVLSEKTFWGKSDIGAQCLGIYEKEILNVLERIGPFEVFLDIGAADGYYAVGMLHAQMTKKAICMEISNEGQRVIRQNWRSNNRPGFLTVLGEATPTSVCEIADTLPREALVLIDIEGSEFSLLTESVISSLKDCTVIIEVHHWVDQFFEVYAELLKRLDQFYWIKILEPAERNTYNHPVLGTYCDDNRLLVASERRPSHMRFLHCVPKRLG